MTANTSIPPLISILMTTKDRPHFLKNCLQSIEHQTEKSIEVILVNDGGCDLRDVIKPLRLNHSFLVHQESRGIPQSLNKAARFAHGQYFAICDDDDLWTPNHLKQLLRTLKIKKGSFAYSDVIAFCKNPNQPIGWLQKKFDTFALRKTNYIVPSSILFARALFETLGGFDETMNGYSDWDFFLRAAKQTSLIRVPSFLTYYRIHTQSHQNTTPSKERKKFLRRLCTKHVLGNLPVKTLYDHFKKK